MDDIHDVFFLYTEYIWVNKFIFTLRRKMYIDAIIVRKDELIKVVERSQSGERIFKEYKPDWHFYVDDLTGSDKTIYGTAVKKIIPTTYADKQKLTRQYTGQYTGKKWESDVNPVFRTLEQEYLNANAPHIHTAFFDIETDFDPVNGYSSPADALNPITSIAIYLQWSDTMICFAVPPKTLSWSHAQEIASDMPQVLLCKTEKEMLNGFIDVIGDADVISGWNSEMYDIPYTINRIVKTIGKSELRRLCLWDQAPKRREFERGGKKYPTYDLFGRIHLDYMQLYKKYTYQVRHSYALNAIAELELGDQKVPYEGTLDDLYKKEFKKFLEYNIQDTFLLHKLDQKLQYIDLCSSIAHSGCVLLPTSMGTVAMTDQTISIEAHNHKMVVPDKKLHRGDTRAAGGWVAYPKKGLHKWVGSADLNSLYPSVIRAVNMSPETIVAQVDLSGTMSSITAWEDAAAKNSFATWWNDRFCPLEMDFFLAQDKTTLLTLKFENGETFELTGAELHQLVFESGNPWCISANGTIYNTTKAGVIPRLLTRWYAERKVLQGIKRIYESLDDNEKTVGYVLPDGIDITDADLNKDETHVDPHDQSMCFDPNILVALFETKDKGAICEYINMHNLHIKKNKIIHRDLVDLKKIVAFWDKRQLVKKIVLNSLYGAILNAGSRFFDQRIGQSITLTGRNITKHMAAKTNEYITGKYDYEGECIIYGDTDSVVGSSVINTTDGPTSIEDLFNSCTNIAHSDNGKEYGFDKSIKVLSYNSETSEPYFDNINYIYRHRVTKDLYEIEDTDGNKIIVTEDHSIMVKRDDVLIEVKPYELNDKDTLITCVNIKK